MPPLVSVIILNYHSPEATVRCVRHLLKQSVAPKIEILVVDNHSCDDSVGVFRNRFREFPSVRIIEAPRNLGFGGGCNLGARFARGDYLLINNPDKLLEDHGIEKLVEKIDNDDRIGIIGPSLVHGDGTVRSSARAFPRPVDVVAKRSMLSKIVPGSLDRYLQLRASPGERAVDWVVGGCFLIRRDFFLSLDGFDERFFLFFEDIDLCRRVHASGKSVLYFPSVTALDRKSRLSEGGVLRLLCSKVGRAHMKSAGQYFMKWGWGV